MNPLIPPRTQKPRLVPREDCHHCEGTGKQYPECETCEGRGIVPDPEVGRTMECPDCCAEECNECYKA